VIRTHFMIAHENMNDRGLRLELACTIHQDREWINPTIRSNKSTLNPSWELNRRGYGDENTGQKVLVHVAFVQIFLRVLRVSLGRCDKK
jgi:hypothetical protein